MTETPREETAILAGGCFWCLEAAYLDVRGVTDVKSGYIGGKAPNPTYEEVCSGRTGHAEAVRLRFDPSIVSYRDLLEIFFSIHDPTQLNRQGADIGTQYRSAVFATTPEQEETARAVLRELAAGKVFAGKIVTTVAHAGPFYPAEAYHDRYFERNPGQGYCQVVIAPKLGKFRQKFASLRKGATSPA
ncbi:MAG TPA: peptide-methionine (S)-S-oxide reductase MsrA [Deinococcales bacterium]|nr:peptide-methionine (S)-S-oxide reductase MsrA [Deinococcales bacterium]